MILNRDYFVGMAVAVGLLAQITSGEDAKTESPSAGRGAVQQKLLADSALLFFVPFDSSVQPEKVAQPSPSADVPTPYQLVGEGTVARGVVGQCLSLSAPNPPQGREPRIEYWLTGNLDLKKGAMMLWFKPYWSGADSTEPFTLAWVYMKDVSHYFAWHRSFDPREPSALHIVKDPDPVRIAKAKSPAGISMKDHFKKDRWVHLAATWDAEANKETVYVNGQAVASALWGVDTSDESTFTPRAMLLGPVTASDLPVNGALDELYIFKRALAADEIAAYCNETAPKSP